MGSVLQKIIAYIFHSLFNDMSKRTSEDLSNAIEIPDPINLEGGDDEEELSEGSANETPSLEVMISCIQTTSGVCSLISLYPIP